MCIINSFLITKIRDSPFSLFSHIPTITLTPLLLFFVNIVICMEELGLELNSQSGLKAHLGAGLSPTQTLTKKAWGLPGLFKCLVNMYITYFHVLAKCITMLDSFPT